MRSGWIILLTAGLLACGQGDTNTKKEIVTIPTTPTLPVRDTADAALKGIWQLVGLPQSPTPFGKLYPTLSPNILIEPEYKMMSGSTGCNRFSATITTIGSSLRITNLAKSKIACVGTTESTFLEALDNSTRYSWRNPDELVFGTDSVAWMIFRRR